MIIMFYFLFGIAGALCKDIFRDGALVLPYYNDGKVYLGFIGSAILGGFVAYLVDHSFLTAFLSGYVGFSFIENIIVKNAIIKKSF